MFQINTSEGKMMPIRWNIRRHLFNHQLVKHSKTFLRKYIEKLYLTLTCEDSHCLLPFHLILVFGFSLPGNVFFFHFSLRRLRIIWSTYTMHESFWELWFLWNVYLKSVQNFYCTNVFECITVTVLFLKDLTYVTFAFLHNS